ncbi:MAG: N-acetylmuramoyl-L-alanine amidase [Gammaproteobacteria bacterium]|jgi:N-acetylmuramoyl-L-alanine amidase
MNRQRDIKTEVLRGVYEDNAGIPRSSCGSGRARLRVITHDASQDAGRRPQYRVRVLLVGLLGLIALLGINFRLVTVNDSGPVAMQVSGQQTLSAPVPTLSLLAGLEEGRQPGGAGPALSGLAPAPGQGPVTTGNYEAMLARLGMPMADLFDLKVQTIVIDPGHGGIDPGATGHQGLMEKDVALDIARRLRDKLAAGGHYRILLTREEDKKVYLKERVAFAKEHRADLFISIHINSLPPEAAHINYIETYYFGPHTDQRSLDLAEKENHDSDYAMGDFREVIARIGDTLKTEESRDLARSIHLQLYENLRHRSRGLQDAGIKTGPFMVLLGVEVPSVLVEVSCISNKAEELRLGTPEYRDSVADHLRTGIVEYLERRAYPRKREGGKNQYVARQEG